MTEVKKSKHQKNNKVQKSRTGSSAPMLNSQIIIAPDKDKFVFIQQKSKPFIIMTSFQVENGTALPCLRVPINRISHAQNILKLLPGGVVLNSDGNWISIDVISKIISFDSNSLSGLIQFQLTDKTDLNVLQIVGVYQEVNHTLIQYIMLEDDPPEIQPDTLNISSIMLDRGTLVCITDAIEKVLMIPVKDTKTGYVGSLRKYDIKLFNIYKKIWPELKLKIEREGDKYCIYSKVFKYDLNELDGEHYIRVHRNYGGTDLQLTITHKLMDIYSQSVIDYNAECK